MFGASSKKKGQPTIWAHARPVVAGPNPALRRDPLGDEKKCNIPASPWLTHAEMEVFMATMAELLTTLTSLNTSLQAALTNITAALATPDTTTPAVDSELATLQATVASIGQLAPPATPAP